MQAKKQALIRDNRRCLLSGVADANSYYADSLFRQEVNANPPAGGVDLTECCHIIPQNINNATRGEAVVQEASSTILSVLERFGGINQQELLGSNIHSLRNALTLRSGIHKNFDRLDIWLDPVEDQPHTYRIGRRSPLVCVGVPAFVTFESTSPNLELPDRRYLALHASCAKVLHLSGATTFADSIIREIECTKVLSQDGSSVPLLDYLLPLTL
ncbi:hypothetical protein RSOLAG1IB_06150 [Rhizoctonia solani AG-1 IB]|uniref:HNH nuclease domain-containing protein n=1 Tax=Thanatephorus cucumeris (strain AG1-IB / isolate 7/3/14) TaxID=1108050 RepID=A0A0B7FAD8_THACB|nr:hypothetical protein RSOLAG1IB_06150 [Rhizoctonia solani AG-1 IB]